MDSYSMFNWDEWGCDKSFGLFRTPEESTNHCNILAIWKHAIIAPVPKPYKPTDLGTSYRLISLLCPSFKVLEH